MSFPISTAYVCYLYTVDVFEDDQDENTQLRRPLFRSIENEKWFS